MSNLVERLRSRTERVHDLSGVGYMPDPLCAEAAAEIKRLTAELDELDFLRHEGGTESVAAMEAEIARLRGELSATIGYMTNAAIDLKTGAPKRTALATIEGGITRARAAIGGSNA